NLPVSSDLEANYRTVLTLTVKQHMGESWTNQDSTDLRAVANLCPETYGEAVVIARGMLPAPESYSFGREGNDTACGQLRSDGVMPSTKETAMIIWPNPADDMLTIGFERPFSGTLEIINSSGAVVRSLGMNETVRENIPTDILVNGIYFLRVSAPGQAIQTQKFSVLH
ncbi:MAG: T9SS type A sorting domain-containing protein, partial [Saprospiraceae bacterium]|nr:T9SS type A sorting domain-containing protein [Saprospiraceae bacterium]